MFKIQSLALLALIAFGAIGTAQAQTANDGCCDFASLEEAKIYVKARSDRDDLLLKGMRMEADLQERLNTAAELVCTSTAQACSIFDNFRKTAVQTAEAALVNLQGARTQKRFDLVELHLVAAKAAKKQLRSVKPPKPPKN